MSKDNSNPAPPELRHLPVKRWQAAMSWWRSLPAPGPSASRAEPGWPFPWTSAHTLTLNRLRCSGSWTTRLRWPLSVGHWATQQLMAEPTCKYPGLHRCVSNLACLPISRGANPCLASYAVGENRRVMFFFKAWIIRQCNHQLMYLFINC